MSTFWREVCYWPFQHLTVFSFQPKLGQILVLILAYGGGIIQAETKGNERCYRVPGFHLLFCYYVDYLDDRYVGVH